MGLTIIWQLDILICSLGEMCAGIASAEVL